MPHIDLEPFSENTLLAYLQARELHRLVGEERDWLRKAYGGSVKRYGASTARAARNIIRLAKPEEFHAYLVKYNVAVRGIATIITGQTVSYGDLKLTGHDLDYWIEGGRNELVHAAVATRLIEESIEVDMESPMFAVMNRSLDVHHRPHGLADIMRPVATNVRLIVPSEDPYDIAKQGTSVDLYQLPGQTIPVDINKFLPHNV